MFFRSETHQNSYQSPKTRYTYILERDIIDGEVWEGAESTKEMILANQNRFQPIKLIFRCFRGQKRTKTALRTRKRDINRSGSVILLTEKSGKVRDPLRNYFSQSKSISAKLFFTCFTGQKRAPKQLSEP